MNTERRPIPGYEGRYDATSDGKIISLAKPNCTARRGTEIVLTPRKVYGGYQGVLLYPNDPKRKHKVNERIHRLVCAAFHGPSPAPNYTVNHKDLNKKNNAASNLEWMTAQDNMAHAIASGAYKKKGR